MWTYFTGGWRCVGVGCQDVYMGLCGFYLQSVNRETETPLVHKLKLSPKYDVIARDQRRQHSRLIVIFQFWPTPKECLIHRETLNHQCFYILFKI